MRNQNSHPTESEDEPMDYILGLPGADKLGPVAIMGIGDETPEETAARDAHEKEIEDSTFDLTM